MRTQRHFRACLGLWLLALGGCTTGKTYYTMEETIGVDPPSVQIVTGQRPGADPQLKAGYGGAPPPTAAPQAPYSQAYAYQQPMAGGAPPPMRPSFGDDYGRIHNENLNAQGHDRILHSFRIRHVDSQSETTRAIHCPDGATVNQLRAGPTPLILKEHREQGMPFGIWHVVVYQFGHAPPALGEATVDSIFFQHLQKHFRFRLIKEMQNNTVQVYEFQGP